MDRAGPTGKAHNVKIWKVASDLPWSPISRIRLPIEPPLDYSLICIQQDGNMERNWGKVFKNAGLHTADSLKSTLKTILNVTL